MTKTADNKLGLLTSTALVVGNVIGAGVFLMPSAMASFGSVGLLGWVFSAIGSFFLAKLFSNLSKLMPHGIGGPYAYTRHGLGDFMGFLVSWGYYISNSCGNAAITISFISASSTFFPVLAANPTIAILTGLGVTWLLTWINTLGIVTSGRVQLVTTILKLLPLIVIAIGGLFFIHAANFYPFNSSGKSLAGAIQATAAMTMFSFVGIECATVPSGDIKDPGKTIARATMLGLCIITFVYILGSVSVMGMIPAAILQKSVTPYADAAVLMFGPSAKYWVSAGVAISAFGCLNGWTLLQGQIPFAIAKDKLFPAIFTWQNKRKVPYMGMIVSSVMVSIFIGMNFTKGLVEQFRFLLLLATLTTLIPYVFSAAAYLIIRAEKKYLNSGSWVSALIIGVMSFAYSLWAIAGSGQSTVYWGFMLLMAGIPFYVWVVYKKKSESSPL